MEESSFDPVTMDIPVRDEENEASIEHLSIENNGERMLGTMFKAQGEGPHPTAIILHGFPGHDRNLDIAHTLRRGGLNSVVFHYRGSWGSSGTISFSGMIEDIKVAIGFLKQNSRELSVDTDRIILIGHSMGAWAGMMASIEMPDIKSIASLAGFNLGAISSFAGQNELNKEMVKMRLQGLSEPMKTIPVTDLLKEIMDKGRDWDLNNHSIDLSGKNILLVWSRNDQLSIPEIHFEPLYESLFAAGTRDLTTHMLDSDHSFSNSRIELQRTIWRWVEGMDLFERRPVRA